jgi:hypothetical protein
LKNFLRRAIGIGTVTSISQAKKGRQKHFTHFLMFLTDAYQNAVHQMHIFFHKMPF